MENTSHPANRASPAARRGEVRPPAPDHFDGLSALLRDMQAGLPQQNRAPVAAAIDAGIARILHLLLALLTRFAAGQTLPAPARPAPAHPAPDRATAEAKPSISVAAPLAIPRRKPHPRHPNPQNRHARTAPAGRLCRPRRSAASRRRPAAKRADATQRPAGQPHGRAASSSAPPDAGPNCPQTAQKPA